MTLRQRRMDRLEVLEEEREDADALGLPADMVSEWEEAAEEEQEEDEEDVCYLLPENVTVMEVFNEAKMEQGFAGMNAVLVFLGSTSEEILSTCRLLRIHPREWEWVLRGIRILEGIIVPALNREAADRNG